MKYRKIVHQKDTMTKTWNSENTWLIKGNWETIFRGADNFYSIKGGVWLYITKQWEVWDYTQWRMVWEFASHHDEKCETVLNEWRCVSWHQITMRSVRLYSMKGGVWVYITSRWEVWDHTQWRVVCDFTSHDKPRLVLPGEVGSPNKFWGPTPFKTKFP